MTTRTCGCAIGAVTHGARTVALTGGPGAGETAVLEVVRQHFCDHVVVLPEAATIVFGGGFPRHSERSARRRAQLAIFHVQDQMERIEVEMRRAALVLCDRGIPDPVRVETAEEAGVIDERIVQAWDGHPHRHFVESTDELLEKPGASLGVLELLVPACCRRHFGDIEAAHRGSSGPDDE